MYTRALAVGIALFSVTTASAQDVSMLDLVPRTPGPYGPAESVDVDIVFVNNTGQDIELRLITLDFSSTDTTLGLPETFTFDTSTLVEDYLYLRFENLPKVDIVYTSSTPVEGFIIIVADGQTHFVGTMEVVTPTRSGTYSLDAINANASDINFGARFTYGFDGRTDLHYLNGTLAGGVVDLVVDFEGCVPPDCDDGVACTLDTCDPESASSDDSGCVNEQIVPCCGDGVCDEADEVCTCLADCGSCCGDGRCDLPEDRCTCPEDCGSCPVCEAVQGAVGSVAAVEGIRRYRSEVLSRSRSGRRLVAFYDQHAAEIVRIMLENRDLLVRTRELLSDLEPAIDRVVDGEQVVLTEYETVEMHALLDDFETEAGPELALAIRDVRRFVHSTKLMVQAGWIIDPDPSRPGR